MFLSPALKFRYMYQAVDRKCFIDWSRISFGPVSVGFVVDKVVLRYIFLRVLRFPGTAVAQLVEALRYKSEGRGFDSRWCHWNFSLT